MEANNFKVGDVIICNEDRHKRLTLKKRYKVIAYRNQGTFYIIDDRGILDWYSNGLFFNASESIRDQFCHYKEI